MLKKYQTDSHVIYGTLRLEIFIKYPLITRESRLFAEIRLIKNVLLIAEKNGEIKDNMNLLLVSDMFYNSYSGLLFYSSFHPTDDFEKKLLMLFENVYSLIKADS